MLNKELLLASTPTSEEGIFLMPIRSWRVGRSFFYGATTESIVALGDPTIYGTDNEVFDLIAELSTENGTISELSFSSIHRPNMAETTVYVHIKLSDGSVQSARYTYDLNFKSSKDYDAPLDKLRDEEGNTLRVYLGPSPTPPISLEGFLEGVAYVKQRATPYEWEILIHPNCGRNSIQCIGYYLPQSRLSIRTKRIRTSGDSMRECCLCRGQICRITTQRKADRLSRIRSSGCYSRCLHRDNGKVNTSIQQEALYVK